MRKFQIIGSRSEIGAGKRGASLGIDALRFAALNSRPSFFKKYPIHFAESRNEILEEEPEYEHAKRLPVLLEVFEKLSRKIESAIKHGYCPLVLAGDHSSAAATIAGIKIAEPNKKLGIVWIDAHADLHTPYTSPSGNVHGMPLAISLGEDNLDNCANEPADEIKILWERMKYLGKICPKINYQDICFIALRDYEPQEGALIRKNKVTVFTVDHLRKTGVDNVIKECLSTLAHCDHIYISFDVDSMDPQVSRGTGTPVPGGLHKEEALELCSALVKDHKVVCFEMTEINPLLDDSNKMGVCAFDILQSVCENFK